MILRLTSGVGGSIGRFQVVREAVIAALRMKFLPAELDGAPLATTRLIEYSFGSYRT